MLYRDLSIRFTQELRKMTPLSSKAEEDHGIRYQMQGIVLSMGTFRNLMEELQNKLPMDEFDKIRNIFNNTKC
jgi:hypothetical protein